VTTIPPSTAFQDAVIAAHTAGEPVNSLAARYHLPPADIEALITPAPPSPHHPGIQGYPSPQYTGTAYTPPQHQASGFNQPPPQPPAAAHPPAAYPAAAAGHPPAQYPADTLGAPPYPSPQYTGTAPSASYSPAQYTGTDTTTAYASPQYTGTHLNPQYTGADTNTGHAPPNDAGMGVYASYPQYAEAGAGYPPPRNTDVYPPPQHPADGTGTAAYPPQQYATTTANTPMYPQTPQHTPGQYPGPAAAPQAAHHQQAYPPPGYPAAAYPMTMAPRPISGASVAALVVGIVTFLGGFALILPVILTWFLAHVGLKETKTGAKSGRGLAIAGNVLGWVSFVFGLLFFIIQLAANA
jgi:hypothetical protein